MPVPLEQFVKQLEDSGILAGDTLKDFIPPKASPKDAEELARELVRKKKLTKFQAEEVYRGKAKSLVLGNYVLMEKIGAGGMGQVFKARHRRMDRLVAVKFLPPAMTKDKAAIARFEREVKAAAKISHQNIVAAHDADCANGIHFLVMELVEGSDLSALVKKNGPFPFEKAVNYVLQAAKGLEAAHKKGIVHRDIKPANLLLDNEGTVKILDMGLARLNGDEDTPTQAELTGTGTVMGTVDYMAPEQALSTKNADARADIYALGCTLHYLLTGKATYGGDTLMAKMLAHREEPIPSLRAACPDVSEQLDAVFRKMIAKSVQDRYQTTSQVIVELERCGSSKDQTVSLQPSQISLSDTGLTDFLKELPTTQAKTAQTKAVKAPVVSVPIQRSGNKTLLMIGGGVVAVLILLAAVIVKFKTKDGTLIVTVNEPDAEVQVLNEEGKVEITKKGDTEPITITVVPGKHKLKVSKDGFELFTQEFSLETRGKEEITARLVPLNEKVVSTPLPDAGEKKSLAFTQPGFDQWVKETATLPAEEQVEAVRIKLMELNPKFDGKVTPRIDNGVLASLTLVADNLTDLSPVRALPGLKELQCAGKEQSPQLSDLSPLQGLSLTSLNVERTQVSVLLPLRNMPLTILNIQVTPVSDLTPLQGMKLSHLFCSNSSVADLSPLRNMPLQQLFLGATQVVDLSPLDAMPLVNLTLDRTPVTDLSPLRSSPLTSLTMEAAQVADMSPLTGMPLTYLDARLTPVSNFAPLKDMPLKEIRLDFKPFRDAELFRTIKTLETINGKPTSEFWKDVEAQQAAFEQWTKDVAALPAKQQVEAVSKKLVELNPGFDGKVTGDYGTGTPRIEQGVVTGLSFLCDDVTDISPLRALKNLKELWCYGSNPGKGKLSDLSPLRGMELTTLHCGWTQVGDLAPVQGMPLTSITIFATSVAELWPLRGMKLEIVDLAGCQVADLSPLKDMPLKSFNCIESAISDLSPLAGMKLTELTFSPAKITKGIEIIRKMESLKTIVTPDGKKLPADEFWKKYDAGEFGNTTPQ